MVSKSEFGAIIENVLDMEEMLEEYDEMGIDATDIVAPVLNALFIALGSDLTEVLIEELGGIDEDDDDDFSCGCPFCEEEEEEEEEDFCIFCDCDEDEDEDEDEEIFCLPILGPQGQLILTFSWEEAFHYITEHDCTVIKEE